MQWKCAYRHRSPRQRWLVRNLRASSFFSSGGRRSPVAYGQRRTNRHRFSSNTSSSPSFLCSTGGDSVRLATSKSSTSAPSTSRRPKKLSRLPTGCSPCRGSLLSISTCISRSKRWCRAHRTCRSVREAARACTYQCGQPAALGGRSGTLLGAPPGPSGVLATSAGRWHFGWRRSTYSWTMQRWTASCSSCSPAWWGPGCDSSFAESTSSSSLKVVVLGGSSGGSSEAVGGGDASGTGTESPVPGPESGEGLSLSASSVM
mmetsp:Transcript_51864/g.92501  ORF Transcript_51864/g.92501 Transcript_51864/m.92501 type:complete len:260 (+) Transcript_51864:85-864(+)